MKKYLYVLFFMYSYLLVAFEGDYSLEGFDPTTRKQYKGTASITKKDDIYQATWRNDDGEEYFGTGFATGGALFFVFERKNASKPGVQVYKRQGKFLEGNWIYLDSKKIGKEKLTPLQTSE